MALPRTPRPTRAWRLTHQFPNPKETMNASKAKSGKALRGFAAMDPDKQRAIASLGGKHAHKIGKAHQFTSEEAREAGRKGGLSRQAKSLKALTA